MAVAFASGSQGEKLGLVAPYCKCELEAAYADCSEELDHRTAPCELATEALCNDALEEAECRWRAASPHHIIGATVAFFTGVQVLAGSYAHDAHKEGRVDKKVTCSEVLHRNLGKLILVGAYVNVYVGANMLDPRAFGNEWFFTVYHVWVPLLVTAIVVMEVKLQIQKAARGEYGFILWWRTVRKKGVKEATRKAMHIFHHVTTMAAVAPDGRKKSTPRSKSSRGTQFGVTGKLILTKKDDRENDDQLLARFKRVLQNHGSEEDFALVEAEVLGHKKETSKLEGLRRRNPLVTLGSPAALADKLRSELQEAGMLGTHTYHLRQYRMCFLGSNAVQLMVNHRLSSSTEDAVRLGTALLKDGAVVLARKAQASEAADDDEVAFDPARFQNGHTFYRFQRDEVGGGGGDDGGMGKKKKKGRKKRRKTTKANAQPDDVAAATGAELETLPETKDTDAEGEDAPETDEKADAETDAAPAAAAEEEAGAASAAAEEEEEAAAPAEEDAMLAADEFEAAPAAEEEAAPAAEEEAKDEAAPAEAEAE